MPRNTAVPIGKKRLKFRAAAVTVYEMDLRVSFWVTAGLLTRQHPHHQTSGQARTG